MRPTVVAGRHLFGVRGTRYSKGKGDAFEMFTGCQGGHGEREEDLTTQQDISLSVFSVRDYTS
jgi:hypothetical protein